MPDPDFNLLAALDVLLAEGRGEQPVIVSSTMPASVCSAAAMAGSVGK